MLTRDQIVQILGKIGLKSGDHLVVHSSLRGIGPIDGGAEGLIEAILDYLGPHGTLAMPTFNYSSPLPEPYFDPATTPGRTGKLTEIFRQRPGTLRSHHPTHSVAACGARAAEFVADHWKTDAFGIDSPLDRIAAANGYVLLIGVAQTSNSTIHVGETHAGVVKFHPGDGPPPVAKLRLPDGRIVDHRLDVTPSCSRAFNAAELPMRCHGWITDLAFGDALSYLMRGRDVIQAVVELHHQHPGVLFCTRPDCLRCIKGRQHLAELRA